MNPPWRWRWLLWPCLAVLYLYGLGRVGLLGPDEPRYAFIGREMAHSGDWITPRLWSTSPIRGRDTSSTLLAQREPWFEKPALLYWLIGLGHRVGLRDEWAARAPVALLSVSFLAVYAWLLSREFGHRAAGVATAVLATSVGWLAYSHIAVTDLPLAAAFGASLLLAVRWLRTGRAADAAWAGALLGVAVLAKGLVPLVLALPVVLARWRQGRGLAWAGLACLTVALPWYALCYAQNGPAFPDEFIWKHHVQRFATESLRHEQPFWFYAPVLLGLLFPWSPLAVGLFQPTHWREPRRRLLLAVVGFGFLFFSTSTNKLPGYLLPLLPPVAALIGIAVAESRVPIGLLAGSVGLLGLLPLAGVVLPDALNEGLGDVAWQPVWLWVVPLCAVLAWMGGWAARRRPEAALALGVAGMAVGVAATKLWLFPILDERVSVRGSLPVLRQGSPPCLPALSRAAQYGRFYYSRGRVPLCEELRTVSDRP